MLDYRPLLLQVMQGGYERALWLLLEYRADATMEDKEGIAPLMRGTLEALLTSDLGLTQGVTKLRAVPVPGRLCLPRASVNSVRLEVSDWP